MVWTVMAYMMGDREPVAVFSDPKRELVDTFIEHMAEQVNSGKTCFVTCKDKSVINTHYVVRMGIVKEGA